MRQHKMLITVFIAISCFFFVGGESFSEINSRPDSIQSECPDYDFECLDGRCIPRSYLCDGFNDCAEGEDEEGCSPQTTHKTTTVKCSGTEFECLDGFCIPKYRVCDGYPDCNQGDDEIGCSTTDKTTTVKCSGTEFQCLDGFCIPKYRVCDGYPDCNQGDDEIGCSTTGQSTLSTPKCSSTEFECWDGICIPQYHVCNGYADCNQGEDEIGCTTPACESYEFQCWDGQCIPQYYVCNLYPDCSQGEDEIGCVFTTGSTTPPCTSTEFQCWDGQCIPGYFVCNDYPDCSQGEDELDCGNSTRKRNAMCETYQYKCMDGQCINEAYVCDGFADCSQGEDEADCSYTTGHPFTGTTKGCSQDEYQCSDGKCIPKSYLCDGFSDCHGGEDERDCYSTRTTGTSPSPTTPGCDATQFECWDGKCIPLTWVCDGVEGCSQGEDELYCTTTTPYWTVSTTTYAPPPPVCEHPYDTVGDRCVVIDPVVEANWDEARYVCERIEGDLVIIDSIVFFSKLIQYINDNGLISRDYWIGGTDRDREGKWKWINGANITMGTPLWAVHGTGTSTYEQEPKGDSNENCGYLDKARFYYMDDNDCLKTKAVICQIPTWHEEDPAFIPKVEIVDEERKKEIFEMTKINHQ